MSASLVGSEMCIRDSLGDVRAPALLLCRSGLQLRLLALGAQPRGGLVVCLLYTSDAADDM
eukprot:6210001-Alexandrium_andersonii.AAC.1